MSLLATLYAFDNESILNLKVAATWTDTEVIGDVQAPGPILIGFEGDSLS